MEYPEFIPNVGRKRSLKTPAHRSHNKAKIHNAVIEIAKLMARRAAEEDFRLYNSAHDSSKQDNDGI